MKYFFKIFITMMVSIAMLQNPAFSQTEDWDPVVKLLEDENPSLVIIYKNLKKNSAKKGEFDKKEFSKKSDKYFKESFEGVFGKGTKITPSNVIGTLEVLDALSAGEYKKAAELGAELGISIYMPGVGQYITLMKTLAEGIKWAELTWVNGLKDTESYGYFKQDFQKMNNDIPDLRRWGDEPYVPSFIVSNFFYHKKRELIIKEIYEEMVWRENKLFLHWAGGDGNRSGAMIPLRLDSRWRSSSLKNMPSDRQMFDYFLVDITGSRRKYYMDKFYERHVFMDVFHEEQKQEEQVIAAAKAAIIKLKADAGLPEENKIIPPEEEETPKDVYDAQVEAIAGISDDAVPSANAKPAIENAPINASTIEAENRAYLDNGLAMGVLQLPVDMSPDQAHAIGMSAPNYNLTYRDAIQRLNARAIKEAKERNQAAGQQPSANASNQGNENVEGNKTITAVNENPIAPNNNEQPPTIDSKYAQYGNTPDPEIDAFVKTWKPAPRPNVPAGTIRITNDDIIAGLLDTYKQGGLGDESKRELKELIAQGPPMIRASDDWGNASAVDQFVGSRANNQQTQAVRNQMANQVNNDKAQANAFAQQQFSSAQAQRAQQQVKKKSGGGLFSTVLGVATTAASIGGKTGLIKGGGKVGKITNKILKNQNIASGVAQGLDTGNFSGLTSSLVNSQLGGSNLNSTLGSNLGIGGDLGSGLSSILGSQLGGSLVPTTPFGGTAQPIQNNQSRSEMCGSTYDSIRIRAGVRGVPMTTSRSDFINQCLGVTAGIPVSATASTSTARKVCQNMYNMNLMQASQRGTELKYSQSQYIAGCQQEYMQALKNK
jgi:hypothetical protein